MSSENIVKITSFHRDSGGTTANFNVNFENHRSLHGIVKVVVKTVDIPNVFYNINSTGYNEANMGNNTYSWIDNLAVQQSVVVPEGQYTLTTLLSALNVLISTQPGPHTWTFNAITNKLESTSALAIIYQNSDINLMADTLGIKTTTSAITAQVNENFPNLSGVSEVYIVSNTAGQSNLLEPNSITYPLLANIPITVPFGGIEHYISQHPEIDSITYPNFSNGISFRSFDVRIVDKYANLLELGGLDINLILKVYHNY